MNADSRKTPAPNYAPETTFGERLRRARRSAGLGQKDLETLADLGAGSAGMFEIDGREPTIAEAMRLAKALDVDWVWLALNRTDAPISKLRVAGP